MQKYSGGDYHEFIKNIEKNLGEIDPTDGLYRLNYMHLGTELKLFAIGHHLSNLQRIFTETNAGSAEGQNRVRCEFDAILYSGKCVLDKLSQEAKILFEYPEEERKIDFDVASRKKDIVGQYFGGIKALQWYKIFNEYRNTSTHRNVPIFTLSIQLGGYSDPYKKVLDDAFTIISEEEFIREWEKISKIFLRKDGSGLSFHLRENPSDLSSERPAEDITIELVSFSLISKLIIEEVAKQTYKKFQKHISETTQ